VPSADNVGVTRFASANFSLLTFPMNDIVNKSTVLAEPAPAGDPREDACGGVLHDRHRRGHRA
jgi:hypothetical protein